MRSRVGRRYRINAYAEESLYMKLLAYKSQSGLTESAIVNLALYYFFSGMEKMGMFMNLEGKETVENTEAVLDRTKGKNISDVYEEIKERKPVQDSHEHAQEHEEVKEKKFKLYFDF